MFRLFFECINMLKTFTVQLSYSSFGHTTLIGKLEEIRQFAKCMCRWRILLKVIVVKKVWENVDWICLAQIRCQWWAVVNMVMTRVVP